MYTHKQMIKQVCRQLSQKQRQIDEVKVTGL